MTDRRRFLRSARRLQAAADYLSGMPVKHILENYKMHASNFYKIVDDLNLERRDPLRAAAIRATRERHAKLEAERR